MCPFLGGQAGPHLTQGYQLTHHMVISSHGQLSQLDPAPLPPKGGRGPQFSAHVHCGQRPGWIKMPLGMELGLHPSNIMLDGDNQLPLPKKGAESPPQFSAHVYCGQTAGLIKMSLGMEVGLDPSVIGYLVTQSTRHR